MRVGKFLTAVAAGLFAVGLNVLSFGKSADAAVITYDMSWTGEGGYSLSGFFSFDDSELTTSPLVRLPNILAFEATAFRPNGTALETYAFSRSDFSIFSTKNFIFNFTFESDTEILRQTGSPAGLSPDGLVFGAFTPGQVVPNGWLLYGGNPCVPSAGLKIVLDDSSAGCLGLQDFSRQDFVQVTQRVSNVQISEPGTFAILCLGVAGLSFALRRKTV